MDGNFLRFPVHKSLDRIFKTKYVVANLNNIYKFPGIRKIFMRTRVRAVDRQIKFINVHLNKPN